MNASCNKGQCSGRMEWGRGKNEWRSFVLRLRFLLPLRSSLQHCSGVYQRTDPSGSEAEPAAIALGGCSKLRAALRGTAAGPRAQTHVLTQMICCRKLLRCPRGGGGGDGGAIARYASNHKFFHSKMRAESLIMQPPFLQSSRFSPAARAATSSRRTAPPPTACAGTTTLGTPPMRRCWRRPTVHLCHRCSCCQLQVFCLDSLHIELVIAHLSGKPRFAKVWIAAVIR